LLDAGHGVTVYHRGQTEAELPVEVRHIRSPRAAMPVMSFPDELLAERFDVVIHMIAMGEADASAAVHAFRGRIGRMVVLSSGDVYRAYGRFTGIEPGPVEAGLLHEESPLRSVLYPYRKQAASPGDWTYHYEKILVEREALGTSDLPATVLRLPKVYVRAATHPAAVGRIYNVGEEKTPTVAERLAGLPGSSMPTNESGTYNFEQDIAYDTSRIRRELGYAEAISYEEGMRKTLESLSDQQQ